LVVGVEVQEPLVQMPQLMLEMVVTARHLQSQALASHGLVEAVVVMETPVLE
jgi:hypothetical protein